MEITSAQVKWQMEKRFKFIVVTELWYCILLPFYSLFTELWLRSILHLICSVAMTLYIMTEFVRGGTESNECKARPSRYLVITVCWQCGRRRSSTSGRICVLESSFDGFSCVLQNVFPKPPSSFLIPQMKYKDLSYFFFFFIDSSCFLACKHFGASFYGTRTTFLQNLNPYESVMFQQRKDWAQQCVFSAHKSSIWLTFLMHHIWRCYNQIQYLDEKMWGTSVKALQRTPVSWVTDNMFCFFT